MFQVVETAPGHFETVCPQDEGVVFVLIGSVMGGITSLAFIGASVLVLATNPFLGVLTVPAAFAALALFGFFARELWVRTTRMGRFVLDAPSGSLFRNGSSAAKRVARIRASSFMAPAFSSGGVASWWLVADVVGGGSFRLAKGSWSEVRPLLGRLRQLGLQVEGHDAEVLLKTRYYSVTQLAPTRFEFSAPETSAKRIGAVVVAGWVAFAGLMSSGFVYSALDGSLDPGAALFFVPMALFFAFGISVGVVNLISLFRRSGVFVLDVAAWTLERNGQLVARPGEIAHFRMGNPTPFGLRRSRLLGPQALAVELRTGRRFLLVRGLPGDVRFAASVLAGAGVTVEEG